MLRCAIVEDDAGFAEELKGYVRRFSAENGVEIEYTHFPDGLDIADDYQPVWDLILLDIEMPHMNGMETARYIRRTDPNVVLVFITNMARYAINGYEVQAMDFILKPLKYPAFAMKLKKVLSILRSRQRRHLIVSVSGENRPIPTDEILFIEVRNHVLHIHTANDEIEVRGSMQDMEEKLKDLSFFRIGNSYIVNLRNITAVKKETVAVGKYELPVSRPKRKELMQRFSEYMGGSFQ